MLNSRFLVGSTEVKSTRLAVVSLLRHHSPTLVWCACVDLKTPLA